jgi:hypothetical protein
MLWAREAQDSEYWHLLVVNEKMKEDEIMDPCYLFPIRQDMDGSRRILQGRKVFTRYLQTALGEAINCAASWRKRRRLSTMH